MKFEKGAILPAATPRGFTILEVIVAMAIGLVALASAYSVFVAHNRTYKVEERIAEMIQNARAGMDMMTREVRMAGYDPFIPPADAGIVSAQANSIEFTMDITSSFGADQADGDTDDQNEHITYLLYTASGIQKLGRRSTANAVSQPVADHISALSFRYFDAAGLLLGMPVADTSVIRRIEITLTARTALPDPRFAQNGGYRTYTLTSMVTPRNLGL